MAAELFRKLRGRRLLCSVGLLAIVIFLFLQIFSFKILSGTRAKGRELLGKVPSGVAEVEDNLAQSIDELKRGYQRLLGLKEKRKRRLSHVTLNSTTGVKPALRHLYVPDKSGLFTCLDSKETLQFSKVNDDYCDCSDSSDEPGTAACSHDTETRFYCGFQVSDSDPLLVSSTRVNDGICDCCDGSDEWAGVRVPPQVALPDSDRKTYSVVHAPCYDLCDELRQQKLQRERMVAEGRLIKQEYIEYGRRQSNPDQIYGPDGEFAKLKGVCLEHNMGEFEYNICPFESVRQQSFPHAHRILGRKPVWVSRGEEGVWQLRLEGGDKDLCPGALNREVLIEFHCGIKDEVVQLNEQEKCRYQVLFRTPAAC